jgi:hypothetical protein
MARVFNNVLVMTMIVCGGYLFRDDFLSLIHIPEGIKLFTSLVLNPPSFSEWGSMNNVADMCVTGLAYLIRAVMICSLAITALFMCILFATLIGLEIKSTWTKWKH